MDKSIPRAIGIDVGGTKIAAGIVNVESGEVVSRQLRHTQPHRTGDEIFNDVLQIAESLASQANSIGLGLAELVGPEGEILSEATFRWKNIPVQECLSQILPTTIEADVRAAARAETKFGAGSGLDHFLYVTIGTGISSCLVIDGKPYVGARGLTGTFASAPTAIPIATGSIAHGIPLESFSSGVGIATRFKTEAGLDSDAQQVFSLAKLGNEVAMRILDSAGVALGAAIAQLVNTLDPQAVVLGGGIGCAEGLFHDSLRSAFRKHVWSELHSDVPILTAKLGINAGWIGAALASVKS